MNNCQFKLRLLWCKKDENVKNKKIFLKIWSWEKSVQLSVFCKKKRKSQKSEVNIEKGEIVNAKCVLVSPSRWYKAKKVFMNEKQASLSMATMIGTKPGDVSSQNYFIETIIRRFDEKRKKLIEFFFVSTGVSWLVCPKELMTKWWYLQYLL